MYKAIEEIGGYKIGEVVPAEKAEVWLKMYKVAPVEEVTDPTTTGRPDKVFEEEAKEPKASEEKTSNNVMLDDYLGRNTNVVKKNVEEDNLSQEQLKNLLELEKSDKKRDVVIKAIKKKLKD